MSWRTVCITKRCKLEYRMGYLLVRDEEITRVHISEISVLIIENTAVSLTVNLLQRLSEAKIKVIFCDDKHNPCTELLSYYGSHDSSRSIRSQIAWSRDIKGRVWQHIVEEKIRNQARNLLLCGHESENLLLKSYAEMVEFNDESNREGHAAKVYFNTILGGEISRDEEHPINSALDYGYSLLLAAFNREISANGNLTQLGIWHGNVHNPFNLASDLMEAFRPLVDYYVLQMQLTDALELSAEHKHELLKIFELQVEINGCKYRLLHAIAIYVKRVLDVLNAEDFSFYPKFNYDETDETAFVF